MVVSPFEVTHSHVCVLLLKKEGLDNLLRCLFQGYMDLFTKNHSKVFAKFCFFVVEINQIQI